MDLLRRMVLKLKTAVLRMTVVKDREYIVGRPCPLHTRLNPVYSESEKGSSNGSQQSPRYKGLPDVILDPDSVQISIRNSNRGIFGLHSIAPGNLREGNHINVFV